jgi:DNA-binding response OmpR family regulator
MGKILILEDEKQLARALAKHLKGDGHETDNVYDTVEAFKKLEKYIPDLILLDIVLPGMDGITFLESIRKMDVTKDIPVILLSNLENREKMTTAAENGVTLYFIKANLSLKVLSQWVKELLEE